MIDRTLFRAKKVVTREDDGWKLDIILMFDGREYLLTEFLPISIDCNDVYDLISDADPDSMIPGDKATETIDIENAFQFDNAFHAQLTDDAAELLEDVYVGRFWTAQIVDASGNRRMESAYLSDTFYDLVMKTVKEVGPCWMEISFNTTTFNKDWALDVGDLQTIYNNIQEGLPPLVPVQVASVLKTFVNPSRFNDREEFNTTVTKQGNSLVLKVTDQCRRMGVDVGDELNVTMSKSNPSNNMRLRVFDSRHWMPIDDPDSICHRDGCDLTLVKRFLDDFKIIGTVNSGSFIPGRHGQPYYTVIDHVNFFKTESGENLIVTQPYIKSFKLDDAKKWAALYGCTVEEHRDYSWHYPPETTLLIFRRIEKPLWKQQRTIEES